jgi:hypothetical protein
MANEVDELSDSLSEFQRRFAQLPDVEEPPQTFLHLLGQESEETNWTATTKCSKLLSRNIKR